MSLLLDVRSGVRCTSPIRLTVRLARRSPQGEGGCLAPREREGRKYSGCNLSLFPGLSGTPPSNTPPYFVTVNFVVPSATNVPSAAVNFAVAVFPAHAACVGIIN